ncbi:MAG: ribosome recycling factor [Candidatus Eisenbacteria bacterium]|uniref:Ribosome-recycling factor n=1 Tax=Eiseniibacteriota bacterium TaxID=2212470 RepID=A0A538SCE0_UNCEI|nr:MAG: ribosome recycling factor [Candidatus Eisenbacteria bacterium]
MNPILANSEERMKKVLEATRRELAGIRGGKATPALLDTVRVEAYGQAMALNQVGSVTAPEPRLLVVQPWDKSLIKAISRALQQSELGLNPTDDGVVVRVPVPALSEERRRDLVKVISKLAEEGRVHIRQIRHDVNKDLKHQQTEGKLSEDDGHKLTAEIQKLTDRYIGMVDEVLRKKTAEVMEV